MVHRSDDLAPADKEEARPMRAVQVVHRDQASVALKINTTSAKFQTESTRVSGCLHVHLDFFP